MRKSLWITSSHEDPFLAMTSPGAIIMESQAPPQDPGWAEDCIPSSSGSYFLVT